MSLNVNPKLRNNIQFLDILELFEKHGYSQDSGNNFLLMLEITNLIGCIGEKDEKNVNRLLAKLLSEIPNI
jgi:hypothetical protein